MNMTEEDIKASIKKEEGLRLDCYEDSMGVLTIGYGHSLASGSRISIRAAETIFDDDFNLAMDAYQTLDLDLDSVRKSAIVDMIFNMGISGVKKFEHFLFALRYKDWVRAANELMDSRYAKQVPNRAKRNRDKILYGEQYGRLQDDIERLR